MPRIAAAVFRSWETPRRHRGPGARGLALGQPPVAAADPHAYSKEQRQRSLVGRRTVECSPHGPRATHTPPPGPRSTLPTGQQAGEGRDETGGHSAIPITLSRTLKGAGLCWQQTSRQHILHQRPPPARPGRRAVRGRPAPAAPRPCPHSGPLTCNAPGHQPATQSGGGATESGVPHPVHPAQPGAGESRKTAACPAPATARFRRAGRKATALLRQPSSRFPGSDASDCNSAPFRRIREGYGAGHAGRRSWRARPGQVGQPPSRRGIFIPFRDGRRCFISGGARGGGEHEAAGGGRGFSRCQRAGSRRTAGAWSGEIQLPLAFPPCREHATRRSSRAMACPGEVR